MLNTALLEYMLRDMVGERERAAQRFRVESHGMLLGFIALSARGLGSLAGAVERWADRPASSVADVSSKLALR